MKKVLQKLNLTLCLLIACFNTFAQTPDEILVNRSDLERCALYKRTNELLEREIKFQAVNLQTVKDSAKAREERLNAKIATIEGEKQALELSLSEMTDTKDKWQTTALTAIIALLAGVLFLIFKSRLAKFLPFLIAATSIAQAQGPDYRPPVSINGQKGVIQSIVVDSAANKFGIESANGVHTIRLKPTTWGNLGGIPNNLIYGTGSNNYLPKYSGPYNQSLSQIFDNGTSVAIGTVAPNVGNKLEVSGNVLGTQVRGGYNSSYVNIFSYMGVSPRIATNGTSLDLMFGNDLYFYSTGDLQRARLTTTGLRLGTGAPAYTLDVGGNIGYSGSLYAGNPTLGIPLSNGTTGQFLKRLDFAGVAYNKWENIGIPDVTNLQTNLDAKLPSTNVNGTTNNIAKFTGANTLGNSVIVESASNIGIGATPGAYKLDVSGTARINDNTTINGTIGIGAAPLAYTNLRLMKSLTGATTAYSILNFPMIRKEVSGSGIYYFSQLRTQDTTFTLPNAMHFYASQGTLGAASTVTNQYAYFVESTLTGAANNYAYYSAIPSGANRWNLYMAGSASNYLAGKLGIGTSALSDRNLALGLPLSGTGTAYGFINFGTVQAGITNAQLNFSQSNVASGASVNTLFHFSATQGVLSGSVTSQVGFIAGASLNGGASNIGFWGDLAAGSGRWNLYMPGTANNYLNGNLWIGTSSGSYKLDVAGTAHVTQDATFDANVIVPTAPTLNTHAANKAYIDAKTWPISAVTGLQTALDAKLSGSGTANYLPKYTGTLTQGNSQVFDNGTNVAIGHNAPASKLDVNGDITVRSGTITNTISTAVNVNGSDRSWRISSTTANTNEGYQFHHGTTGNLMFVRYDGNVGIGTTTPNAKLHVNGNGLFQGNVSALGQVTALGQITAFRFAGSGATPSPGTAGAGLGSFAAVNIAGGSDTAFRLNITAGDSPSAGADILTVNFGGGFNSVPFVTFSEQSDTQYYNSDTSANTRDCSVYIKSVTTSGFVLALKTNRRLITGQSYSFTFHTIQ